MERPKPIFLCNTCKWWKPDGSYHYAIKGDCRRSAPLFDQAGSTDTRKWPVVSKHDWCGEHERLMESGAEPMEIHP